ncbi:hypothetical protein A3Q56_01631 [Intoshia linei]|uniref:RING-type E3 ubiquitin transferase n=1 Tax=Intoshia linei TaxID=1819745 RepID=A0A177BAZ0_9BILA|nr:hypothetical protein A3Q56_01631 [Intoshia linei]
MSLKVDVEKVDVLYFSRHDCLLKDLTSDSRISCTIKEVEEFDQVIQKENPDVKSNFNSHCFFFLALSYEETIIYLFRLKEYQNGYIENFKKTRIKLDAFRKSRNMDSLDSIIMFMDFFINDFSNTIDVTEKYFTLNDASRNVIYYIDRLSAVVASMISINKDESLDKIFRMFPERFLQIIINASEYLMSSRLLMPKSDTMNIFKVIILGICRHDIFISPYMVSKFINVLQILLPIHYPLVSKTNYIIDDLNMKNHIPKAIMNYYVNVENTGSSNDFYDKFSIRFSINLLLRKLWYNQDAKEKMIEFSKTSEFIKFINMALNDVIYLFDENISTLKKMKNTQMVINDVSKYNALTENEQKMRRQELQNSERILLSMIKLLMQLLKMIVMFTLKIKEPFMKEELLDRFTVMLNFTFYELSGENSASIKIDNPEKIGWSPCDIVKNLIHIYINLSNEKFIESMAKDERSFDSNKFKSACERLKETKIPNIELEHMINIIEEAESFKRRLQLKEVYYGEIPQKYRDPLMDTLMLNPVKLPGGGVMDKHVILRHLLNSSTDPFNRNYLDESLLVEDVDLKQEIDQWIMSKHKNMSDQ